MLATEIRTQESRNRGSTVTTSSKQLSALSRLFSSTIFRELATKGKSVAFSRLAHETGILSRCLPNGLVRDVFEIAFKTLKQDGLRDEYIYKAALTHRVLMGQHSSRCTVTASIASGKMSKLTL